jgi:hypothetical protein
MGGATSVMALNHFYRPLVYWGAREIRWSILHLKQNTKNIKTELVIHPYGIKLEKDESTW